MMSSNEGYRKFTEDPEGFFKKIGEISHIEGIFKIKVNPTGNKTYYNLLEMYKNDSNLLLRKAYSELKDVI
jgi:hypothetical protein